MSEKKIADLSHYQGEIDWYAAREELDLAIFRASVGSNPDKKYVEYAELCGVPFGAYHYVKAGTAQEAQTEARYFVQRANAAAVKPLFYVADIEYGAQTAKTTREVTAAFLNELRALGCGKVGLYIGQSRYPHAGDARDLADFLWIPRYGKNDGDVPSTQYEPKYPCDLWQYTSNGRIAGVNGRVDLNILHGDKPLSWFTNGGTSVETEEKTMLSNIQLVAYCEAVLREQWAYWYGTCGYECTTSLYNQKKEKYPQHYTASRKGGYEADIAAGKRCADCSGLIKSFFWKGGEIDGANVYKSHNMPDTNAEGILKMCDETGDIGTIPDIPGLVVWKSGHIGVYVGGGYTIEMRGFAYDCVKRKVSEGPWTKWGKLPASVLSYTDIAYAPGSRTLFRGCVGDDVEYLQEFLMQLGFALPKYGADGDYGSETEAAVRAFQNAVGLEETGAFADGDWKLLNETLTGEATISEDEDMPEDGGAPVYALVIEGDKERLAEIMQEHGGKLYLLDEFEEAKG